MTEITRKLLGNYINLQQMITTLIFDLGNVILTNDWHDNNQDKFQEYLKVFGIDYKNMEKGWNAAWSQFSVGQITEDEFWENFLSTAGARSIDIEKAKELWRKYQKPIDNMLELLSKLKAKYKLGALTTISREWLDFKRDKFHLDDYFEVIVSSGYLGKGKPEKIVYEVILSKLNVLPQNSVFIDDTQELLKTAAELGIKTIHFKNEQQLANDLRKLGVEI